jgi:hypothetical protein
VVPPPHCVARIANTHYYTALVSVYSTDRSAIVMDAGCALCEVGARFVCTVYINVDLEKGCDISNSLCTVVEDFTVSCVFRPFFLGCVERYIGALTRSHDASYLGSVKVNCILSTLHCLIIQVNHQPDATVFQFIILTFIYSSTCFGCFPAHHHELNDCSGSLWFYLRIVVIVVLCSWSGRPAGWLARPRTQHDCHHDTKVKP